MPEPSTVCPLSHTSPGSSPISLRSTTSTESSSTTSTQSGSTTSTEEIYEGRQVYMGPANRARQYFIDMGYEPANRQTTADSLVAGKQLPTFIIVVRS